MDRLSRQTKSPDTMAGVTHQFNVRRPNGLIQTILKAAIRMILLLSDGPICFQLLKLLGDDDLHLNATLGQVTNVKSMYSRLNKRLESPRQMTRDHDPYRDHVVTSKKTDLLVRKSRDLTKKSQLFQIEEDSLKPLTRWRLNLKLQKRPRNGARK